MENNKNIKNMNKILKTFLKGSPNSKWLKEYKRTLNNLSNIQWEMFIGLILGDVSLQTQNKRKTNRMKFEWEDKNKIYTNHIYTVFDVWILSPSHKKMRININDKIVYTWSFQIISHEAFNPLSDLFIVNKNKGVINNLINNYLTLVGLAYWFPDYYGKLGYNKSSKNQGLVLNTHSFRIEEVEIMSIELSNKFDLNIEIKLNKNKSVILIKSESYTIFTYITNSFFNPSMRYKISKL